MLHCYNAKFLRGLALRLCCVCVDVSTRPRLHSFHISMQSSREVGRQNPTLGEGQETGASLAAPLPSQPSCLHPHPFPSWPGRNCFDYWHISPARCLQFTARCHHFQPLSPVCYPFLPVEHTQGSFIKTANLQKEAFTLDMQLSNDRKTKCKTNHRESPSCISCIGARWLCLEITDSPVCCMHSSSNPSLREKISS